MSTIAMEEYELMKDSKYRVYVSAVDKALKNFDYTSEWADLISALGKLNKVLMGHQKFPVIPRRIKISKRLAQCMHPALPSGVHLKALETYDIIFRCMGTNRLSHELFIYSAGLFPLLAHAAMNVRPSLLTVYETHFVPLGERLRPGLSGFLSGVLPGLEEGSDHFQRANCLLEKVCDGVGPSHFHGCLWDCVAANSAIRLPAISFVLAHFNRKLATEDQRHVMGTNLEVMAAALCGAARDSSVLVQRSALDLLLVGFPIHTTLLPRSDVARLVQAALAAVLRRDMSLNRRLFAWLLGTEVNLSLLPNDHPLVLRSKTDGSAPLVSLYFELYSRETLEQAIRATLLEGLGKSPHDLRPYRLLVSLLDKPDIGPVILDSILCDVFRALYLETGGCPTTQSCQELVKCANLLFSTLEPSYIWQHCATLLSDACKRNEPEKPAQVHQVGSGKPGLFETCLLTGFLLDAVSVETHPETPGQHLPGLFRAAVDQLTAHSSALGAQHMAAILRLATKILSRVARPDPPPPATPPPEHKPLPLTGENQSEGSDRTRANSDLSEYKNNKAKSKMKKSKTAESKVRLSSGWERELADSSPVLLTAVFNTPETPVERTHLSVASLCSPPSPTVEHSQFIEPEPAVTITVPTKEQAALAHCQRQFQSCFLAIVGQDTRTLGNKCDQLYGRLLAVRPRETLRERTDKLERLLIRCINQGESIEVSPFTQEPVKTEIPKETVVQDIFPDSATSEIAEPVSVACLLLVQLSAFPTFEPADNEQDALPPWLQVLLTVACFAESAPGIQLTATRTLLDLLAKAKERQTGTLTGMVTRKQLRYIECSTTAVSTLSRSLWNRLGQSDIHQSAAVELLLDLHSAVTCDDVESVLGQALGSECLAERTDAFRRFQTLWHVGRDVGNVGKHHRTLDKALLKTLDTLLATETSPLKLQAQSWLLHSLVRGDTPRILDPLLSILLDPTTARMSVLHVNVQSAQNTSQDCEDAKIFAISSEEGNVIYHVHSNKATNHTKTVRAKRIFAVRSLIDRSTRHFIDENKNMSLFVNPFVSSEDESFDFLTESAVKDKSAVRKVKSEVRINEKSEAAAKLGSGVADDKTGGLELESMTRWSSGELEMSTPAEEFFDSSVNVAESIIEDILTAVVKKCESNKIEREERTTLGFHPIHQHMLLYCGVYDSNRTLYALHALRSVMVTNARMFLCCAATTGLAAASGSSHLIGLLARHRKSVFGKSFSGEVGSEFCAPYRSSMYLEVVVSVCLYFARSFYPNLGQMRLTPEEIAGNRQVQLASAELLTLAAAELAQVVRDGGKGCASYVADMLARCKVNKIALHCLDSSVHCMRDMQAESPRTFTEEIVGFNDPAPEPSPSKCRHQGSEHSEGFQVQLLRLVLSLIMLEHQVNALKNPDGAEPSANSTSGANGKQLRYLPGVPIPQQPMFLASVLTALQLKHCRHLHQHWNVLVTSALPFMGSSLSEIVIRVSTQLCENLESLAARYLTRSHSPECCRPADFAATQLEALTALTHFCLLGNASNASVLGSNQGQVVGNLLSVFMPSLPNMAQPIMDVASVKDKTTLSDTHVSARRSALGNLPRIVACIALLWEAVGSNGDTREAGNDALGNHRVVRQQLLELLSPISLHHGVNFLAAVAVVWHQRRPSTTQRKVIPVPSPRQQVLVSLVAAIRVLPMDTLVQTVHQVVKQPLQANNNANESAASLEASVLELFYAHVLAGTHQLAESWPSLLGLLRDGLTLTPPAQFLMLAILNQFIQRCPPLPDKKDQRDLQDITAKLVESCSAIAGSCLEQTTWLRRNLAVREEDLSVTGTKPENGTSSLSQYSVQAQAVLAELLAPLMDVSYGSQEKERVVALLATLMANIVPYLRNHTARNASSYLACVTLLSSLSGFPYMRKAWRRDAMDLLLEPPFFRMQPECLPLWRNVVDNLMTHDTTTFRELMNKLSVSQGTGLSLFSSREAEYEVRAQLLKRLAFVVLCSETDQYQKHMPEIQERLADSLRLPQVIPGVQAAVFLCCRVLLLRMSPQHVTSLWPVIISEMVQVFLHIEQELSTDTDQFSSHIRLMSALDSSWVVNASNGLAAHGHPHWAQLQLAAGKLLDIALLLPAQQLPQFQMYRWAFVGCADAGLANSDDDAARSSDFVPHVVRIARLMDAKYNCPFVPLSVPPGQPLLTTQTIGSLRDLRPFFAALASRSNERSNLEKPQFLLEKLEQVVERDFLEPVPQR